MSEYSRLASLRLPGLPPRGQEEEGAAGVPGAQDMMGLGLLSLRSFRVREKVPVRSLKGLSRSKALSDPQGPVYSFGAEENALSLPGGFGFCFRRPTSEPNHVTAFFFRFPLQPPFLHSKALRLGAALKLP